MNRGRGASRGSRAGSAAGNASSTTPGGRGTPSSSSSTTARGGGPGARRATAAAPVARFRPKNIRRDEAERENIAREEERKESQIEADERRANRGRGGRFRAKRGRGDAMGASFGRGVGTASGPFSSIASGSSGGWFSGGGGGSGSGGGGGFRIGGTSSRSANSGGPNFRHGIDPNRETRINADKMHVLTVEDELTPDDVAGMDALHEKPANSLPMGIYRRKHRDAGIVVATTAELEAAENATGEEESLWVDGDGAPVAPVAPPEEGVWGAGDKAVKVKEEQEDPNLMDIDPKVASPEEKKKLPVEVKIKKAPPPEPEETLLQTDLNLLAHELGTVTITSEDGTARTEGPADKDGRMYLFQFPPLLPPLKVAAAATPGKGIVKNEPQEVNLLDTPPAPDAVDLTGENVVEGEENEEEDDKNNPENKNGFMSSLMSQGGMIGELRVRKSGKVELDWGGRTLELSPATSMNFLSTAVILEENDSKPHPETIGGESIGMGKIMGRFILSPTWADEEDWNVTEEELRIDEATAEVL